MAEPVAASDAAAEVRSVRRLLLVALAAAGAASAVALVLELLWQPATPAPLLGALPVPAVFRQAGFVSGVTHHVGGGSVPVEARAGALGADVRRGPVAIVVACSTGTVTVRIGPADASAHCTGRATGVIVINAPGGRLDVHAAVSTRQPRPWTIGMYQ